MAISLVTATADKTASETLRQTKVDSTVVGGYIPYGGGEKLAGVTPEMATNIATSIETYKTNIETILNKLETVESNAAFQGTSIKGALDTFVTSIKSLTFKYLTQLVAAENAIVSSVATAYATQDTELGSNLTSDANTLTGETPAEGGVTPLGPTVQASADAEPLG